MEVYYMLKQITIENVLAYKDMIIWEYPDFPTNPEYLVQIINLMSDAINQKDVKLCYHPIKQEENSEIEIVFDFEGREYCYGFEYNDEIEEEWLYCEIEENYVETIFERNKENSVMPENVLLISEAFFAIINQALEDAKNTLINNYDRMELELPKGMKAEIAERVKEGKADSNNAYVVAAVREKMEREDN